MLFVFGYIFGVVTTVVIEAAIVVISYEKKHGIDYNDPTLIKKE